MMVVGSAVNQDYHSTLCMTEVPSRRHLKSQCLVLIFIS